VHEAHCPQSCLGGGAWVVDAGVNDFFGREEHSFFGQFENNSNIYVGVRYNFGVGENGF